MIDKKAVIIVILAVFVVALLTYIVAGNYQRDQEFQKQQVYLQGVSDGRLLEQRDAFLSASNNGYYDIAYVDQDQQNQVLRLVRLDLLQQQAQQ